MERRRQGKPQKPEAFRSRRLHFQPAFQKPLATIVASATAAKAPESKKEEEKNSIFAPVQKFFAGDSTPIVKPEEPYKPPPEIVQKIVKDTPVRLLRTWMALARGFTMVPGSNMVVDFGGYMAISAGLEKFFKVNFLIGTVVAGSALGAIKPAVRKFTVLTEDVLLHRELRPDMNTDQVQRLVFRPPFCGPALHSGTGGNIVPVGSDNLVRCMVHDRRGVAIVASNPLGSQKYGGEYPLLMQAARQAGMKSMPVVGGSDPEVRDHLISFTLGNETSARKVQRALSVPPSARSQCHDWVVGKLLGYEDKEIREYYKRVVPSTKSIKSGKEFDATYAQIQIAGKEWLDRN